MDMYLIINLVAMAAGLATIIGTFYAVIRNLKMDLGARIDKIDLDVKTQNKRMDHMFEIIRQESIAHTERTDAYNRRTDQLYEMMMRMIKEGYRKDS